ncbi:TPA: 3-deoxy-7-phosphoheptulonate synthase, partial [Pseudomonas aeruginosa]
MLEGVNYGRSIATRTALIRAGDILALRATLARVARGEALVVQCGDCAEDMDD